MKNNDKTIFYKNQYNKLFSVVIIIFLLTIMWNSQKQGYEHFNENFYKQGLIIQYYNQAKLFLGDKYISPAVIIGKDGWLEYATEEITGDYQKNLVFSKKELRSFENQIKNASEFGQKNNIEILIVIAPNKTSIYPDKLPREINILGNKSRLDQVLEFISPHPKIQILDLRPALQEARNQQATYFKTDTHWNQFGAYIAYSEIINSLTKRLPLQKPYPQNTIEFSESNSIRDLASIIKENYTEESFTREKIPDFVKSIQFSDFYGFHETTWTPNSELPTALIYHDSFGYANLNDYLILNFGKAYFIHLSDPGVIEPNNYVSPNIVEYFRPNIIIIEVAERNIQILPTILDKLTTVQ